MNSGQQKLVIGLADVMPHDRSQVGEKAWRMAWMLQAGLPVPPGFVVTRAALQTWLRDSQGDTRYDSPGGNHAPQFPTELDRQLLDAWDQMSRWSQARNRSLAARSSAIDEDTAVTSRAGQYETVLGVDSRESLREALVAVARSSEKRPGTSGTGESVEGAPWKVAVLLQPMIAARAAGVFFSRGPGSTAAEYALVEAVWGLGEGLVSGRLTPQQFRLDRDGDLIEQMVVQQPYQVELVDGSPKERRVPESLAEEPILDADQLKRLYSLAGTIVQLFGAPQDIEWALGPNGTMWILQSRPITTGRQAVREDNSEGSDRIAPEPGHPTLTTRVGSYDVPLYWQSPADRLVEWRRNVNHVFAEPRSPLGASFSYALLAELWQSALSRREIIATLDSSRSFCGYGFRHRGGTTPEWERRWEEKVESWGDAIDWVDDRVSRWHGQLLPLLRQGFSIAVDTDLSALSHRGLMEHFLTVAEWEERFWWMHFHVLFGPEQRQFRQFFQERIAPLASSEQETTSDWPRDYADLLVGSETYGMEEERQLHRLAQFVTGHGSLRDLFLAAAPDKLAKELGLPAMIPVKRPRSQDGEGANAGDDAAARTSVEQFCAMMRRFLGHYGYRLIPGNDLGNPSLWERPGLVLARIKTFVGNRDRDPGPKGEEAIVRRNRATDLIRSQLEDDELRVEFDRLLRRARAAWPIGQDHNFYLDQRARGMVRAVVMELGRRLAEAGALERPGDIAGLYLDELLVLVVRLLIGNSSASSTEGPMQRTGTLSAVVLAASRMGRVKGWSGLTVPRAVGRLSEVLDTKPGNDETEDVQEDESKSSQEDREHGELVVRGMGASRGRAWGPVRLIRSAVDCERVQPGDVVVTPLMMPSMSAVCQLAAAIVSDGGGTLSHGAIIARENGIPAVVGAGNATHRLRDTNYVVVDGNSGEVRRIPPPFAAASSGHTSDATPERGGAETAAWMNEVMECEPVEWQRPGDRVLQWLALASVAPWTASIPQSPLWDAWLQETVNEADWPWALRSLDGQRYLARLPGKPADVAERPGQPAEFQSYLDTLKSGRDRSDSDVSVPGLGALSTAVTDLKEVWRWQFWLALSVGSEFMHARDSLRTEQQRLQGVVVHYVRRLGEVHLQGAGLIRYLYPDELDQVVGEADPGVPKSHITVVLRELAKQRMSLYARWSERRHPERFVPPLR